MAREKATATTMKGIMEKATAAIKTSKLQPEILVKRTKAAAFETAAFVQCLGDDVFT
jgi:hypothetical protein